MRWRSYKYLRLYSTRVSCPQPNCLSETKYNEKEYNETK